MYIPPAFHQPDLEVLHEAIEKYSFGVLVSQIDGQPFATHLPFLLERTTGQQGSLIGHTAKANPQCSAASGETVLSIFSGPHAYISPTWYAAENVVPTWNYVAVHVYGKLRLIEEKQDLLDIVTRTTTRYEQSMPQPWTFDGTATFIDRLLDQVVGFRIEIERIEGKWKLNQNHPAERQARVIDALQHRTDENSQAVSAAMQRLKNPAQLP